MAVPRWEADDLSTSAISQPEAAAHRVERRPTLAGQSLRPLENGHSPDKVPTREEARQALQIAIEALKIHTRGLNDSERLVMQNLERYLNPNIWNLSILNIYDQTQVAMIVAMQLLRQMVSE